MTDTTSKFENASRSVLARLRSAEATPSELVKIGRRHGLTETESSDVIYDHLRLGRIRINTNLRVEILP